MLIGWYLLNTKDLTFFSFFLAHSKFLIITVCFMERCEKYFVVPIIPCGTQPLVHVGQY